MREKNQKSMMPNLGNIERVVSLMGGSYMLYDALTKERKSFTEAISAGYLLFRGATGYCPMYEAIVPGKSGRKGRKVEIKTSMTVDKPRSDVYQFWRKLENLPLFMNHLESVTTEDGETSVWKAKIPGGIGTVSWEAVIVEEEKNKRIKWKSLPGSTIENDGTVTFRESGQNKTEIDVTITYSTPLGAPGDEIAQALTPVFRRMVTKDIENFKKYMETGRVPETKK